MAAAPRYPTSSRFRRHRQPGPYSQVATVVLLVLGGWGVVSLLDAGPDEGGALAASGSARTLRLEAEAVASRAVIPPGTPGAGEEAPAQPAQSNDDQASQAAPVDAGEAQAAAEESEAALVAQDFDLMFYQALKRQTVVLPGEEPESRRPAPWRQASVPSARPASPDPSDRHPVQTPAPSRDVQTPPQRPAVPVGMVVAAQTQTQIQTPAPVIEAPTRAALAPASPPREPPAPVASAPAPAPPAPATSTPQPATGSPRPSRTVARARTGFGTGFGTGSGAGFGTGFGTGSERDEGSTSPAAAAPTAPAATPVAGRTPTPTPTPSVPASGPASPPTQRLGDGSFIAPLAEYPDFNRAARLVSRLQSRGAPAQVMRISQDDGAVFRVGLGPFASRSAADAAARRWADGR